ncbi:synaptosomal-associated protein 25-like isoform X1 [Tigriopus californicus]|uniref:synaptosomal-associated protein 25-like isoform X1 n=1 Tax=Tigriopus californicus TaxID=6832 RepID=UPI0027DA7F0E|nr:synaptosomal-associated protein 25-like isoform X1 [Tigriopus californicus]XP_059088101.1 synaptosomal-associated protein 25-like isoform X1 [Tigriopus californicus]XP_059088102.1 synaptosomal-associated protein 25-like isoform X1 [Tigriopus californicus]XP_059088103.1 synaptosomal-associated protein 25-like isoform X1 [Tigriopus californicus]|eukprot:TCALIF_08585-PA protein Name:"Similar to Snap25 Synaptosomal-associated protein 25 (Drosophila melanogaster)" AED:0.34 eAED:0.34 QI:395/1/1/1/0.6/0.5/6/350/213
MAAEGQRDEGPPLTELESLQLKSNQVTDDSLESTRRMISMCEDSQAAGTKTLELLDVQGEQLNRIEEGMDNMNAEMKQAEKHLTGMEKWCGLCIFPWRRQSKVQDTEASWSKANDKSNVKSPTKNGSKPSSSSGNVQSDGPYIQRINNDAREDEMEENMQSVGNILGNLKAMASEMGNEIETQNNQIDRLNTKSQLVDARIGLANKRTEKLLK